MGSGRLKSATTSFLSLIHRRMSIARPVVVQ
jgi:hypothetical protein